MRSTTQPKAPEPAEIQRLLTQLRRIEARSGRRAASIYVSVPPGIDPQLVVQALLAHVDELEILAGNQPDATVCRVVSVDFELVDDLTLETTWGKGK